jgi:hypothetical protein
MKKKEKSGNDCRVLTGPSTALFVLVRLYPITTDHPRNNASLDPQILKI